MKQINRGPEPIIKARSKDEIDLVVFRHMEFRRVPDPDPVRLQYYESTITSTAATFYRRNRNLCTDSMYEIDDLKTFAYVWTCNFIGLYELPSDAEDQNLKLLRTYIGQRFNELRKLLWKKGRNVFAHYDEAAILLTGAPFKAWPRPRGDFSDGGFNIIDSLSIPEPEPLDQAYLNRHRGYEVNSVERRKEAAAKALQEGLTKLGHDRMIEVLVEAKSNIRIHPDAQKHAAKKLVEHNEQCEQCRSLTVKEDEKVSGVEQRSV
jgi:hypothetical protein